MNKVELSHLEGTTKVPGQKENAEESEPETSDTSGNGSGFATDSESQSLDIERSGSKGLADGKATGPRTEQGKQKSSRNATKHGVFSKVIVLKTESRAEYEELLAGLWEDRKPEGTLEELLVEKLAALAWRHRRLLVAEGAEIRKGIELLEDNAGLIEKIRNPDTLDSCLELLAKLRQGIGRDGFLEWRDIPILRKIYGEESRLRGTLYDTYLSWLNTADPSAVKPQRKGVTPEQCRLNVLYAIDAETDRLKGYQKTRTSIEARRIKLEMLRQSVPDSPGLDRLLRYEASLEKAFDRTLRQLEQLQRMRRGQPVAPRIDVNISS